MGNLGRRLFAFKPISRELFGARRAERKSKRSKDRVVNSQGQGGWFDSHPLKGYCAMPPGPGSRVALQQRVIPENTIAPADCVSVTEYKTYLAGLDDVDAWGLLIEHEDRLGSRFDDDLLIAPSAVKAEMEDA
jgi:hypothetical protein